MEGEKHEKLENPLDVDSNTEVQYESIEEFKKRVEESTGVKFDEIPVGEKDDLIGGHIFCKRGEVYVVGVDQYPDEDSKTGEQLFKEFKVVDLSEPIGG